MEANMGVLTSLLLFGLLGSDVVAGGAEGRRPSEVGAQQRAVGIRLHYYLNDQERRADDECRFYILVDAEVLPPVSRKGNAWSFVPRTGQQTVVLNCGGYLVMTPLELDLFVGGTIVLGVVVDPDRLGVEWTPEMPVLAGDSDNVFGYQEARGTLRRRWLRLPAVVRSEVKSGYVIVFRPSSGADIRRQCFAAGFR
jgi:hypothetical protein